MAPDSKVIRSCEVKRISSCRFTSQSRIHRLTRSIKYSWSGTNEIDGYVESWESSEAVASAVASFVIRLLAEREELVDASDRVNAACHRAEQVRY